MTRTVPHIKVPADVERVVARLVAAGYEAYVVGGCVRDALRGVDPHDWDITTNATPEEIQKVFRRSLYLNHFGTVLDFGIDSGTADAIRESAPLAKTLSGERVQQEMVKILGAPMPSIAFRMLDDLGLLEALIPELAIAKTIPQDKAVAEDVFEHSIVTCDATPANDLVLRLAGLLHDIGKPATFADGHFHQHELVGQAMAREVLP